MVTKVESKLVIQEKLSVGISVGERYLDSMAFIAEQYKQYAASLSRDFRDGIRELKIKNMGTSLNGLPHVDADWKSMQRQAEWIISTLTERYHLESRGWGPFKYPVRGGYGHCGFFVNQKEPVWYLGGVDDYELVEEPLGVRKDKWSIAQGGYSLFTPYVVTGRESEKTLHSVYKAPLPDYVRAEYEFAKSTGIFTTFLVASQDPSVFTKKWKRRDPLLIAERYVGTAEGRKDGEYTHEWLVITTWDLSKDLP